MRPPTTTSVTGTAIHAAIPICMSRVTTTAATPTTEPTDKSIPAIRMTMVIPTPMIPTIVTCRATLLRLRALWKVGSARARAAVRATRAINVALVLTNWSSWFCCTTLSLRRPASAGRKFHDGFLAGVLAREFRDDGALAHDQDPVAHAENLRQFRGYDDDSHALRGQPIEQLVDLSLGADGDAPRRFVQDENLWARVEPSSQNDLLLIAAAQRPDHGVDAGRLDAGLRDLFLGQGAFPGGADHASQRRADGLQRSDRGVEGDRLVQKQTERLAVLGQKRDALVDRVGGRANIGFFVLAQGVRVRPP